MYTPFESISISTTEHLYRLHGDASLINEIKKAACACINDGFSLYEAQGTIVNSLAEKYGNHWYQKSAEAVNYIIENEYATAERQRTSLQFDRRNIGVFY